MLPQKTRVSPAAVDTEPVRQQPLPPPYFLCRLQEPREMNPRRVLQPWLFQALIWPGQEDRLPLVCGGRERPTSCHELGSAHLMKRSTLISSEGYHNFKLGFTPRLVIQSMQQSGTLPDNRHYEMERATGPSFPRKILSPEMRQKFS